MKRAMWIAAALLTVTAGTAWPNDTIFTSTSEKALFGTITSMTSTVVNFERLGGGAMEIPVNEITRIAFGNSPDGLRSASARGAMIRTAITRRPSRS